MLLLEHACYKGALFLVAGAIDHEVGTRDISVLAGLRRTMPITALAGGAAALSMAGVPLTLGFVGKDGAYEALLQAADGFPWLLGLMVLASIFLGLAGLIAGLLPFRGNAPPGKEVHDPPWPLWVPPLILAMCGLFVGVAPSLLNGSLSTAATAVAGTSVAASLAVWHGVTPTLLLSALTLTAVAFGYVVHESVRMRTWKPRRGSEDLYEGTLSALDAVSRVIAPALHSASLRTYVMLEVVSQTTLATLGVALIVTFIRLVKGPTLPDRVVAMDLIGVLVVGLIVVLAGRSGVRATLDAAIVIALVGFLGTIAYATYVERGDPQ